MTTPADQSRALVNAHNLSYGELLRLTKVIGTPSTLYERILAALTAAHENGRQDGLEAAAHEFTLNWVKIMQQTQSYDFVTALRQQAKEAG